MNCVCWLSSFSSELTFSGAITTRADVAMNQPQRKAGIFGSLTQLIIGCLVRIER